ncbi:expansin EXLX1 family cellulose-binding protein [Streptomyces sp. NPDC050085]|uniref:expansin EXLX1 family cellulose-binding protein n=1 Tax=Streptomyces sp. NPDC050085 TaxID=3365600 RepID=UPI0037B22186
MAPASPSRHRRRRSPSWLNPLVGLVVVSVLALVATLALALGDDGSDASTVRTKASSSAAADKPTQSSATPSGKPSPSSSPSKSPAPKKPRTGRPSSPSSTTTQQDHRSSDSTTPSSGTVPLAGRIRPGATHTGIATFYDAGDGDGACLYGPAGTVMTAAMNTTDYETSKACGAYIRVRAATGASITVRITNECPAPCAPGQLDLSPQAFAKLAAPVKGQIPITWTLLSPPTTEKISIRYKTGSTQYWCAIQAIGHRNPLARLEVRTSGGWRSLPRAKYNYFLSENGTGCGAQIRLTDIYGQRLTLNGIAVRPNVAQATGVQFAEH